MELVSYLIALISLFGIILLMRVIGAWMLRINDVISELKEINRKIDRMNKS